MRKSQDAQRAHFRTFSLLFDTHLLTQSVTQSVAERKTTAQENDEFQELLLAAILLINAHYID